MGPEHFAFSSAAGRNFAEDCTVLPKEQDKSSLDFFFKTSVRINLNLNKKK